MKTMQKKFINIENDFEENVIVYKEFSELCERLWHSPETLEILCDIYKIDTTIHTYFEIVLKKLGLAPKGFKRTNSVPNYHH